MRKLFLPLLVFFFSCKSSPDFAHLSKGMKGAEVLQYVGVPNRKIPIGNDIWWIYEGMQDHLVILNHDTVIDILTKEEAASMMKHALDSANAARKK